MGYILFSENYYGEASKYVFDTYQELEAFANQEGIDYMISSFSLPDGVNKLYIVVDETWYGGKNSLITHDKEAAEKRKKEIESNNLDAIIREIIV